MKIQYGVLSHTTKNVVAISFDRRQIEKFLAQRNPPIGIIVWRYFSNDKSGNWVVLDKEKD